MNNSGMPKNLHSYSIENYRNLFMIIIKETELLELDR